MVNYIRLILTMQIKLFFHLFLYTFFIAPLEPIDFLGRKEQYRLLVVNHETADEKIFLQVFREKGRVLELTVKLNKIQPVYHAKVRSTSKILAMADEKKFFFNSTEVYFCKRQDPYSYYFDPCSKPLSSDELLRKEKDGYANIVHIDGLYDKSPTFVIRLLKTDNTELKIYNDGSKKLEIFEVKGSSADVAEILVHASAKLGAATVINVFIEGKEKVVYGLKGKKCEKELYLKYLPLTQLSEDSSTAEKISENIGNSNHFQSRIELSITERVFTMEPALESKKPHLPVDKVCDACSSREEIGTLLLSISTNDEESIQVQLDLESICRELKPSQRIDIASESILSIEATCSVLWGVCYKLLKDDLHIMTIVSQDKPVEVDNIFCKREILATGSYLYVRCSENLSSIAKQQKKKDEYVHLIFLEQAYTYIRVGEFIKIVNLDNVMYTLRKEEPNQRIYTYLGSRSPIKYLLVRLHDYDADITKVAVFTEGKGLTAYCLDRDEKKLINMSKFIQC